MINHGSIDANVFFAVGLFALVGRFSGVDLLTVFFLGASVSMEIPPNISVITLCVELEGVV